MRAMQVQPHRKRSKWRRFIRENGPLLWIFLLLIFILALVAVLFWVMGSIRFVNSR